MLTTETDQGIVTITLTRPGRLNALTFELLDHLREAFETYGHDPTTRAIVLTGTGRAFSSGADLQHLDKQGTDLARYLADAMPESVSPLCKAILAAPVPVVAAVNGVCAGGGVGLALLADVTIAARSAYFLLPQAPTLNLVPDVGATWVLARQVGRARALGISLLGDRISAEEAVEWGLIWRCVDDDACADVARDTARKLAASPAAVVATRGLIDTGCSAAPADQLADEARLQAELAHCPTAAAAIATFARRQ